MVHHFIIKLYHTVVYKITFVIIPEWTRTNKSWFGRKTQSMVLTMLCTEGNEIKRPTHIQ